MSLEKYCTQCGSIYLSVNRTNPSIFFGGTWVEFGTGRTLVGVDTNYPDFDTVEKTGGEIKHMLNINEMPYHSHYFSCPPEKKSELGESYGTNAVLAERTTLSASTIVKQTGFEGGGVPHNNLQPYITCYMWKRTA